MWENFVGVGECLFPNHLDGEILANLVNFSMAIIWQILQSNYLYYHTPWQYVS